MKIDEAMEKLKSGLFIRRISWNDKEEYSKLEIPDRSEMTPPHIFIGIVDGKLVPIVCNQADMLADDWQVVD